MGYPALLTPEQAALLGAIEHAAAERADCQRLALVLTAIANERARQRAKFGDQSALPNGTHGRDRWAADVAREQCEHATKNGTLSWRHILDEEYCEAMAETDPAKLRAELLQVATVCVAWIEAIDRRTT